MTIQFLTSSSRTNPGDPSRALQQVVHGGSILLFDLSLDAADPDGVHTDLCVHSVLDDRTAV